MPPPERILCLTFTKAAAAEMAVRLQRRLGDWVTMPDAHLAAALAALDVVPEPATLDRARALFARVLDLPGGMRIGTIHAFCQALLRRFPLEAALSPHFELMEDSDTALALDAAREAALAGAGPRCCPRSRTSPASRVPRSSRDCWPGCTRRPRRWRRCWG